MREPCFDPVLLVQLSSLASGHPPHWLFLPHSICQALLISSSQCISGTGRVRYWTTYQTLWPCPTLIQYDAACPSRHVLLLTPSQPNSPVSLDHCSKWPPSQKLDPAGFFSCSSEGQQSETPVWAAVAHSKGSWGLSFLATSAPGGCLASAAFWDVWMPSNVFLPPDDIPS